MTTFDWDPSQSIIRLIDKTNDTPTLAYDIIAGNKLARLTIEQGDDVLPNGMLYLQLDPSNQFVTVAPILVDKVASDTYLLETKIAQVIGGVTYYTDLQRFRLSNPIITDDKDLGWVLQIQCEHIAYQALLENYVSLNEELNSTPTGITPKQRVEHLIAYYNASAGNDGILFGNTTINIPDTQALKRDYFPTSPQTLFDAFGEVLDILNEPGALGGVFKNYYYRIEANASNTRFFDIIFEEFGASDSGVTINSTTNVNAALIDRTTQTSDKKRKNVVIVKFNPRSGTLPSEHMVFRSQFNHAKFRPEWVSMQAYAVGDLVKLTLTNTTPYTIRFFECISAVTSATNPDADSTNWMEDFTIIPDWSPYAYYTVGEIVTLLGISNTVHYECTAAVGPTFTQPDSDGAHWSTIFTARPNAKYQPFYSYTPWTSDLPSVLQSLANPTSPPSGYVGFAIDWNYARQLNDLVDYTNRYLLVSGKEVTRQSNSPPTGRELFNAQRILVGTVPTGAFVGHEDQIAEYAEDLFVSGHWEFSADPVENDTIFDLATAKIKRFSGGVWTDAWTIADVTKTSPFHLVKEAKLVKGATGIPGQAVQYRFDWKDALLGGDDQNLTSRGAWYCKIYPDPRLDSATNNIGFHYGGDGTNAPNNPQINHQNLNLTKEGHFGWNLGRESGSQGRISSHSFKVRLGFFKGSGDTEVEKMYGKANMAMVYWRKDTDGRFFFKDFILPENNEWFPVTIQLPPTGPSNLYFNRLNELVEVLGYTLPIDFFIQEKDFSGVVYNWRENQSWGVFLKSDVYTDSGMYQGTYRRVLDQLGEALSQIVPGSMQVLSLQYTANFGATQAEKDAAKLALINLTITAPIDHTNLAIDEERYDKEGYAIYPQSEADEPRVDFVHMETETDYLTALAKAEATYVKNQYFPNERYIGCTGDARIRYGQEITESGARVPNSPLTSVVARQKDIIDNKGFNHELYLIRKFII